MRASFSSRKAKRSSIRKSPGLSSDRTPSISPEAQAGAVIERRWKGLTRMALTEKDVRYVAELAHLELTGDGVGACLPHLDSILEYVNKLNAPEHDAGLFKVRSVIETE